LSNYYEGLKVQNLINTYRANPDMFNDDQLDELEKLAEQNQINFKRLEGNFSLRRAFQQAQAGFIEGLTTMDLIPKEPRTTGEAIFRQLGHLAGFAPSIMKAPLSLFAKYSGSRLYRAVDAGINLLDKVSLPMVASRVVKKDVGKLIDNIGGDVAYHLRAGSAQRQIIEEGLGLGAASAISSIWKGQDEMADAFVGGAIAGGAFGGIGNFVSVGNLYKGTPEQVDKANKLLRATVASAFMGLPSTLREEPAEQQIYNYLLGGFFGYNTRPAFEKEASKWYTKNDTYNRDIRDVFNPKRSEDFSKLDKKAQDYILYDAPISQDIGEAEFGSGVGGAAGEALNWLRRNYPETNHEQEAIKRLREKNPRFGDGSDPLGDQKLLKDRYSEVADLLYTRDVLDEFKRVVVVNKDIPNDEKVDTTDSAIIKPSSEVKDLTKIIFNDVTDKYPSVESLQDSISDVTRKSYNAESGVREIEVFAEGMKNLLGEDLYNKYEAKLKKKWYHDTTPVQSVLYLKQQPSGLVDVSEVKNQEMNGVSIGESYYNLPINKLWLGGQGQFKMITHFEDSQGKMHKLFDQRNEMGEVVYEMDKANRFDIDKGLEAQGMYLYSGIKDKTAGIAAPLIDNFGGITYTKDNILDLLSVNSDRDLMESFYNDMLLKDFGESGMPEESKAEVAALFQRKFISNVLHDAILNNFISEQNPTDLSNIHLLLNKGYGKSVADYNKRMQLYADRSAEASALSFTNSRPSGMMRLMIVNDINTTGNSDTDGGLIARHAVFDDAVKAYGFHPQAGHLKPVFAGQIGNSALLTKSLLQRADKNWNKWMMDNDVDFIIFDSSAKLRGSLQSNVLEVGDPNQKKLEPMKVTNTNVAIYELPMNAMRINTGTYEDPVKAVSGATAPLQNFNTSSDYNFLNFADLYYNSFIEPSLKGSQTAIEAIEKYRVDNDIKSLSNIILSNDVGIFELPIDFVKEFVLQEPTAETRDLAYLFLDKLHKLDREGALEEEFEFDSDTDYRYFHESNQMINEAMRGTYVTRNTLFKDNYHNSLRKYLVKRFINPFIPSAGKSWLKAFTGDMMHAVDIDPAKKTRNIREGEIYLDNYAKKIQVNTEYIPKEDLEAIYQGKLNALQKTNSKATMEDVNKRVTLGEAWMQYTGNFSPDKVKDWDKVFNLLVVRVPADSQSGIRVLRFRGFTNQRGVGAFTHHTDNMYEGGADKDSDSVKIFQGINPELLDVYSRPEIAFERKHWENDPEYLDTIQSLFKDSSMNANLDAYMGYNKKQGDADYNSSRDLALGIYKYSPAHRMEVAKKSVSGKDGLGLGLSGKITMQGWHDFINKNGGSFSFDFKLPARSVYAPNALEPQSYTASIVLKSDKLYGYDRYKVFKDLSTLIVNSSADASSDPTIIPYTEFRKLLFNSLFELQITDSNGNLIASNFGEGKNAGYGQVSRFGHNTILGAIEDSKRILKVNQSRMKILGGSDSSIGFLGEGELGKIKVDKSFVDEIGLAVGQRGIVRDDKDKLFNVIRLADESANAAYRINPYKVSELYDLFDLGHTVEFINDKTIMNPNVDNPNIKIVQKMYEMGINVDNLSFTNIRQNYRDILEFLPVKINNNKLTGLKTEQMMEWIEQNLEILGNQTDILAQNHLKVKIMDKDYGAIMDFIGKSYGNIVSLETLTNDFLDIHQALAERGIKGNIIKELIPRLNEENKKLKTMIVESSGEDKFIDQSIIDSEIINTSNKLNSLARKYGISPDSLLNYYYNLLLSPITGIPKNNNKYFKNNFYKAIHASQAIPFDLKANYYKNINDLGFRLQDVEIKDLTLNIDKPKFAMFSDINKQPLKTMQEYIMSDSLTKSAKSKEDFKQVKQFQTFLKNNPYIRDEFDAWFINFTSNLSGNVVPRDSTTMTIEDIYAINKYFKGLQNVDGDMSIKRKHYILDPRYLDETMAVMGMINKYPQYYAPVLTKDGFVNKQVYTFTSPIGRIMRYHDKIERDTNTDIDFEKSSKGLYRDFDNLMSPLSVKEKNNLMEAIYKYREDGIRPTDKKMLSLVEEANAKLTTFFEKVGDKWIYTKDLSNNKVSDAEGVWVLDSDFNSWYNKTGGKLNEYMRWNKDGSMDLKHFRETVIDKNIDLPRVINVIGVDGLKRYQKERIIERVIQLKRDSKSPLKNEKKYRLKVRSKLKGIGQLDPKTYMPHINFGATEKAQQVMLKWLNDKANRVYAQAKASGKSEEEALLARDTYLTKQQLKVENIQELFSVEEIIESSVITEKDLDVTMSEAGSLASVLHSRETDMPGYDKSPDVLTQYLDMVIRGYYKNASQIVGNYEIDNMMYRMRDYKPSDKELSNLVGSNYSSPIQVWADFTKLYLQRILGHQTYFSESMTSGTDPLKLKDKFNLFYLVSDEQVVKGFEKLFQSKFKGAVPFINNAPKDAKLRKEYFSRKIHDIGRLEAQYQLMSLLANTGTWSTNIFSGSMMTAGTAGTKNFLAAFMPERTKKVLLQNSKGEYVVKLANGQPVKNRADILKYYEEKGVIDGFIQNEFEVNTNLRKSLQNAGVNIRDFSNEMIRAIKGRKDPNIPSVKDVARKYKVYDVMVDYGSFIMQNSERINRLNAMIAHSHQAIEKFGEAGRDLTLADDFVFDMGQRGIELSQFLYNNAFRNFPMGTSLGKVLSRFKLFVFNSIRVRKEFYRQAELYGFKKGTESYERFERMYTIDLFLFALASAFMFSVFDTALSPPLDYFQAMGDLLYGDKRERDAAFWGSKLGPLQLLKPPIARIPDSAWELLNGETEKFANYTAYTMFPFGRGIRQIKQLVESPERVGEITLRIPVNQIKSRIKRSEKRNQQQAFIDATLGE
tara:strand:+ start:948 stop:9452 length:8505 start_codon:yes stop_codon:yes gene_type:complete